jgi:hypothetical protein|tara:strand:- start:120 stop:551 length:432 start_codon:yes stop_codon:yes gene_type:complete
LNISSKGDPGGNLKGKGLAVVLMVCVVEIFTTDGINLSARSAKESGTGLAINELTDVKWNKIKLNIIFLKFFIYFFIYQTIKNPNNKKKVPMLLSLFEGIPSIDFSIFFILVGKMAKNNPSIKSNNPRAVMRSFIFKFKVFSL